MTGSAKASSQTFPMNSNASSALAKTATVVPFRPVPPCRGRPRRSTAPDPNRRHRSGGPAPSERGHDLAPGRASCPPYWRRAPILAGNAGRVAARAGVPRPAGRGGRVLGHVGVGVLRPVGDDPAGGDGGGDGDAWVGFGG